MTLQNANLTDRAVIVNLSISQWSAAKSDKKVTREVANNHGSDATMGNYLKYLIARDAVKSYMQLAGEIRSEHYRLTLPWRDTGDRILSSVGYFQYSKTMRDKQTQIERLWDDFCANYPAYRDEARVKLNGLFNDADYPEVSKVRAKFSYKLEVMPVTTANDFRVSLGDAEVSRIQSQMQRDYDSQLNRAMGDVWARMRDVISAMAERLKVYTVTKDGVQHPFRDSLVTNISDLLTIIPVLNLTDDQNVIAFAAEMRDLVKYDADVLRNVTSTRTDVANRAQEILNKMSAFIG